MKTSKDMAKKKSAAQIKASAINEAQAHFRKELNELRKRVDELTDENKLLKAENREVRSKLYPVEELQAVINKQELYIERLLGYMDLPQDLFAQEVKRLKQEEAYKNMLGTYVKLLGPIAGAFSH